MEAYAFDFSTAINSGIIDFQNFILKNFLNPNSSKVLSDYILADFQQDKKTLALTGVNLLNKQRLQKNPDNLNQFWDQFKADFLLNSFLQWRHVKILIKSLNIFKQQMGNQINKYFVDLFPNLELKWKIVLYKSIMQNDQISFQVIYVFLRQTIQQFIHSGFKLILHNHGNSAQQVHETMNIQNQFLKILLKALDFILIQEDTKFQQLKNKLFKIQIIWEVVVQQLIFKPQPNFKTIIQESFHIQNVRLRYHGTQNFTLLNQRKSISLNILTCILKQYNKYSVQQEFDNSKVLLTLQQLSPIIIQQLIKICMQQNSNIIKNFKENIQAMLLFLSTASKFIFLHQVFKSYQQKILFILLPTFLRADQREITKYHQEPKEFINLNCIALEDQIQNLSEIASVKQACVEFLKKFRVAIIESSILLVRVTVDTIKYWIQKSSLQQNLKHIFDLGYNPNMQTCIFILNLMYIESQKNQNQTHEILIHDFMQKQYYLHFEGLDKARFISFLLYCFQNYDKHYMISSTKIIQYVYDSMTKTKDKTIFLYCLQFMEYRIKTMSSQLIKIIWQKIVGQIKITKQPQLIKLVYKIIKSKLHQININSLKELLNTIFDRINSEYQNQIDKQGTQILYNCLAIIQQISQNKIYILQQPQVIELIWPIFQFFKRSQSIQYQDNIIKIFNNFLKIPQNLDMKCYQYLNFFEDITKKYKDFNYLMETYFLLISKGHLIFQEKIQNNINLCETIVQNIQINIFQNRQFLYIPSYILLQFVLILEPQFVKQNQNFYLKTLDLYKNKNSFKQKQNLSAVLLNYLLAYNITFGKGNISIIQQNIIQIFKGCYARLFAINLVKLIEINSDREFLIDLLKYSIRLLHFLKQSAINGNQKVRKKPYQKISQIYITSDPFLLIQQSFIELKKKMSSQRFQQLFNHLQQQFPKKEIRELLMYKQINQSKRQISKIKKIN